LDLRGYGPDKHMQQLVLTHRTLLFDRWACYTATIY